jgi:hypothetical protein
MKISIVLSSWTINSYTIQWTEVHYSAHSDVGDYPRAVNEALFNPKAAPWLVKGMIGENKL